MPTPYTQLANDMNNLHKLLSHFSCCSRRDTSQLLDLAPNTFYLATHHCNTKLFYASHTPVVSPVSERSFTTLRLWSSKVHTASQELRQNASANDRLLDNHLHVVWCNATVPYA